jgi:hypothetical protein
MLAQIPTICPSQIYPEPRLVFCRTQSLNDRISVLASKTIDMPTAYPSSSQQPCEYKDFSVAQLRAPIRMHGSYGRY